ncbi:MAG TPA: trypsin-like peptidase domain-containing protein [Candidatus Coprovivens excrementavium]|nr:trypsin-like peptidase domain-containing protein [Candidatus Coprovivens excrementavium]
MDNNSYDYVKRPKIKKNNIVLIIFVTAIVSAVLGAGSIFVVLRFFPDLAFDYVTNVTKTEKEVTVTDTGIADAVEKIYDAVVTVRTYKNGQLFATGTGFVYKKVNDEYYLLTNYHVIEDGDRVSVVFSDGSEKNVIVENGDKYSDIAVLSYNSDDELLVAELGSSVDMRVGDTVFAIGSPLDSDVYSWSVTRGILSGKDREVEVSTTSSTMSDWIMLVLQTDAAINSGNSGGPLCNSNGQVIGITNMKLITDGVEGMGFAIPIEEVVNYADAIINGEEIARPYIGVAMTDANSSYTSRVYGFEPMDGVLLDSVEGNSPASKAGLKKGDIITAINDVEVKNVASLRYQLYKYKIGETITVKYIRDGHSKTTELTLAAN